MIHRRPCRSLTVVFAAIGLAGAAPTLADAATVGPGCHAPAGAVTIASSRAAHSQVFRKHLIVGGRNTLRYWGCTRSSGRLVQLFDAKEYAPNGKSTFGRLTFAGPYLAALVTKWAPPFEELDVRFFDLSGKRSPFGALLGTSTADFKARLLELHLSSSGRLAWLQQTPAPYGVSDGLRAFGYKHVSPTTYHLDDAASGVITGVTLCGTHLTWRHGTTVRHATLLIASKPRG